MHLNKNHTFSRRALAMLLTLTLCFSLVPSAFAAQQNSYHDPAEHWMQASNRTNELDVNSVVTRETFKCGECGKVTSFEVFRVPEYTRNGQTALCRNVKYSDGTMMDGVGKGDCMDGVPGKDAHYTGYHYTKAVCETCGGINTNEPKSDYGYLKNVYWLFDCAAEFTQKLEETVTYEYTDDTYHTVTTKGGTYCAFCYGTNHTVNLTLERHSMETEVLPQPANGRFATVEKCSLCDYASYDYTAAKAVIADYYGVVDGQPHTITVSDLSEAGVRTSIRYGNSAESCTMTSAPNYTEEGQYTVYYEITYTYQNVSMTENGVANVWLRDTQTSEDGKCTCGCDDPNCGCQNKHCNGNCCADKGCGENHHFILLDRTKAGCITLGYPDLFWRLAEENIDAPWHLMCPHEILTVKGYALEDYWGTEWEKRYLDCVNDPRIEKRSVTVKDIVRLVLRSAVETGTPFAFNRDSVNRMNPNSHTGMIYCSNLCTEIAQNMAPIEHISTEVHTENGDTVVVTATRPGEFVVCNLASLSLGNLPVEDEAYMERTVETAIRALDNVIDLNFYPLEYARLTNQKYRSIGLGVSGYHHMLAKRGIRWESEEHLAFTDAVFEHINYAAVKADAALAREKGRYALFEGSDWQTGAYFEKRGYTSEKWQALAETVAVQGMRNAYLLAVAPTSSTSILSDTSAGIDPIMKKFFLEEKKGSMLPRVAPELSMDTWWYYKAAHLIDQSWSVRAAGLRQRHIDQAQSMNLYITNDYSMRQVLRLYLEAWRVGVKTIYYVRSKALEVEDCESCSS